MEDIKFAIYTPKTLHERLNDGSIPVVNRGIRNISHTNAKIFRGLFSALVIEVIVGVVIVVLIAMVKSL